MQKLVIIVFLSMCAVALARPATTEQDSNSNNVSTTSQGVPFNEEIVVESQLTVRKKDQTRQKRQFGHGPGFGGPGFHQPNYGQSSALANANAFNQYQRPGGFGAGSAMAGAQDFNSHGPLGGFGASATNTGAQNFDCQFGTGCAGAASMGGTQQYRLPGGGKLDVNYGGAFSGTPGAQGASNTHGVNYTPGAGPFMG